MCGCSAHWLSEARCTCTCAEHEGLRLTQARTVWIVLGVRVVAALVVIGLLIYWLGRQAW